MLLSSLHPRQPPVGDAETKGLWSRYKEGVAVSRRPNAKGAPESAWGLGVVPPSLVEEPSCCPAEPAPSGVGGGRGDARGALLSPDLGAPGGPSSRPLSRLWEARWGPGRGKSAEGPSGDLAVPVGTARDRRTSEVLFLSFSY